jgi:hypothetical protein
MTMLLTRPDDVAAAAQVTGKEPAPTATIERAEALILELQALMPYLSSRHRLDVGHNLDLMSRLGEVREDLVAATLAEHPLLVGEGRRLSDWLDRQDELEAEADRLLRDATDRVELVIVGREQDRSDRLYFVGVDALKDEFAERYGEDGRQAFGYAMISVASDLERSGKARRAGVEGQKYATVLKAMPVGQRDRVRRMIAEGTKAMSAALSQWTDRTTTPIPDQEVLRVRDRHIGEDPEAAEVAYGLVWGVLEERFPDAALMSEARQEALIA